MKSLFVTPAEQKPQEFKPIVTMLQPTVTPTPTPQPTAQPTATPTTATPSPTQVPHEGPSFSRMPIENPQWTQGYGPTQYAKEDKNNYYASTSGLHPGLDLGAPEGTDVMAGVNGVVVDPVAVGLSADASPNVVIESNGYYILYGHVNGTIKAGTRVSADTKLGTVAQHATSDHLHLGVMTTENGMWRNHNPMLFFSSASPIHKLDWNDYGDTGFNIYSMQSFRYSSSSFWNKPDDPDPINVNWGSSPNK